MSVVSQTGTFLENLTRVLLVLFAGWLLAPAIVLWQAVWLLYAVLFLLLRHTPFWLQFFLFLLVGLQLDVLLHWPLGVSVVFLALLSGAIRVVEELGNGRYRWRLQLLLGVIFCTIVAVFLKISFQSWFWQCMGVVIVVGAEMQREVRRATR